MRFLDLMGCVGAVWQAVGKVVSAAVVGIMVHRFTPRNCMLVVAALPVFVLLCSFVMREERKPIFGAFP